MPDSPRPGIWVDTDVALGAPRGDVDDGFALAALLAAHRRGIVELLGISTVFGNTTAARSLECARELVLRAGASATVVPGAEGPGEDTAAAAAITSLPPGAQLLCLGPLSNVAAACRRDPRLPSRLEARAVGGNLSSHGLLAPLWPFEFNFALDRGSARFALSREWRSLTLYPLDIVRRLDAGRRELARLRDLSPVGAWLSAGSARWLARARWRHFPRGRFPLWDLPAALDAAGLLDGRHAMRRLARGAARLLGSPREYRCLESFDPAEAWRTFLDLLGSKFER